MLNYSGKKVIIVVSNELHLLPPNDMPSPESSRDICPIHGCPPYACPSDCPRSGGSGNVNESHEVPQEYIRAEKRSADGKHSISLRYEGDKVAIIVDGKKTLEVPAKAQPRGGEFNEHIQDVAISANGEHTGFIRRTKEGDQIFYVDNQPVHAFKREDFVRDEGGAGGARLKFDYSKPNWQSFNLMSLSDDGKHWACIGRDLNADRKENQQRWKSPDMPSRGWQVVIDGEAVTRPVQVLSGPELTFTPDGQKFRLGGALNYPDNNEGVIFYGTKDNVREKIEK